MPYANEHAARVKDPDAFERIRDITAAMREQGWDVPEGVRILGGPKEGGGWSVQSWRFKSNAWTVERAKKWLEDNDHAHASFEPADSSVKASLLHLSLQTGPARALGSVRTVDGVPVRRYIKELIRKGKYVKASDDIAFEVTDAALDHWPAVFAQWTVAGNRVPVPLKHDDPSNPDGNRGWVVDMFREGDSLMATIDLIGDKAAELALTSDVSIFSPAEFTDGKGNYYVRPITHVALCTDPVIPGLRNFEAIAASLSITKETDMLEIAKALGLKDDASVGEILGAIAKLKKGGVDDKKKAEELKASLETAKKEKDDLALSLQPKTPDPLLVQLASENREMKLNALVASARITPAVKDELAKQYVDKEVLALSLAKGDDGFDKLVATLAKNDPVILKEQSGPQILSLTGGPGSKKKTAIAKDVTRRRKAAGLKDDD